MNDILRDMLGRITEAKLADETATLDALVADFGLEADVRRVASEKARKLVEDIRKSTRPNLLDALLAEYGLATPAGTALLRLAEALIRVPDRATMDQLIADKLVPVDWSRHRGKSDVWMVNSVTFALDMTSRCLRGATGPATSALPRRALKHLSTPVIRVCVRAATKMLAGRFVHGPTIGQSIRRSVKQEKMGFTHSYDMLGEAALTRSDAEQFFEDYKNAITALAPDCKSTDFRENPGVSIKLSALHPRYELTQRDRVLKELSDKTFVLAKMAKDARMGINIDAEEADRLELSMEVIECVLRQPELAGWDGFGIVVQAYNKAAPFVLDFLYELAASLDRKIMVRLVKGAYWDTEIKRAQVEGLGNFPVYTHKSATDVAYLCCVRKLLGMTDRIYPQFAGHNAHSVSTILELAGDDRPFEFQRIHGMGEALHDRILQNEGTRCRIYAPVGRHRELLPYLARRMLENGANTSFVSQIASKRFDPADIAADPFELLEKARNSNYQPIKHPEHLFGQQRKNSKGWDLHDPAALRSICDSMEPYKGSTWDQGPVLATEASSNPRIAVANPANPEDQVGRVSEATETQLCEAADAAATWTDAVASERGNILIKASDLYEENSGELFALLSREAGKTLQDATAELREAVDFLRYYGSRAVELEGRKPAGIIACISPWNFPLAIFTGQIAGALSAGNGVIAKPAEQTPLIAGFAVGLLHEAGVPRNVLQLVPGRGETLGQGLVGNGRIAGVAFTGSTETARAIDSRMAGSLDPAARLVAETGGLNAMIIDSTALPEQAIQDIITSSFQSAGQRCSASRMLYVQNEIYGQFTEMLFGAMDELKIGDPWDPSTDVGPLIDVESRKKVAAHLDRARSEGRLLKQCDAPDVGNFVGPAVIRIDGIEDLGEEIFGPVVHLARFAEADIGRIVNSINDSGYGLTFGLHSRIDTRVENVASKLKVGNIYINRNQIGAVVGSQPFGGEGLSGTGPKAGGPEYPAAFLETETLEAEPTDEPKAEIGAVQATIDKAALRRSTETMHEEMPGPTGETNVLIHTPRGTVLCLGPTPEFAAEQARQAESVGCAGIQVAPGASGALSVSGHLPRTALTTLTGIDAVALWSDIEDLRTARQALASRSGPLVPLVTSRDLASRCQLERHVCTDTTAAGGNATLYSQVAEDMMS